MTAGVDPAFLLHLALGLLLGLPCLTGLFFAKSRSTRILAVLGAVAGLGYAATVVCRGLRGSGPARELTAAVCLKQLAAAQMDFRMNDRDGDGKNNFWREDVAGLHALKARDGSAIRLIEASIAAADDRPKADAPTPGPRAPKGGYWFRALRFADEKKPDPDRFAACAFPSGPRAGRSTFIISHEISVYRKEGILRDIEVFPADPLKEGWEKMD